MTAFPHWRKDEQKKKFVLSPAFLLEKEKMRKDYRKSYFFLLVLFLLSFGVNLVMLAFYLKERVDLPSLSRFFSLPFRISQEVRKEDTSKGKVPFPPVYVKNGDHFLLCEKLTKTLGLYRSENNGFSLIKRYPCLVGSNHVDKKEAGDLATPEGTYFLTSFLTGKDLPEKYGVGAFSLNYPNFLDQREGKKGSGIWLHGYPDQWDRPGSSEGCVVVKNEVLKELAALIKIGDTPLVIVDALKVQPLAEQQRLAQELSTFLQDWEIAWESRDTERYLSFYSQNFVSSDGKDYKRFKEYKHQVNQAKTFIELRVEKKSFFLSQKNEGHHAVLRIDQDYRSNNFNSFSRKILYLKEEQGGWRIIGEVSF
ncbi:MAG: hypothetical protein A2W09_04855 [Deltaproteobacteria bacterium RBG_16_50_11]|nr:MAG: hypothetical protein A2W09_04855 [Deltaproteobacteria bacterium RBG_16_50_11]